MVGGEGAAGQALLGDQDAGVGMNRDDGTGGNGRSDDDGVRSGIDNADIAAGIEDAGDREGAGVNEGGRICRGSAIGVAHWQEKGAIDWGRLGWRGGFGASGDDREGQEC